MEHGDEQLPAAIQSLRQFEAQFIHLLQILAAPKLVTPMQREALRAGFKALKEGLDAQAKRRRVPGPRHPETDVDSRYSSTLNQAFTELQLLRSTSPITYSWSLALDADLERIRHGLELFGQPPAPG